MKEVEVDVKELPFDWDRYQSFLKRKNFLDSLLDEKLIDKECHKRSISFESHFVSVDIDSKHFMINNSMMDDFLATYKNLKISKFSGLFDFTFRLWDFEYYDYNHLKKHNDIQRHLAFLRNVKKRIKKST